MALMAAETVVMSTSSGSQGAKRGFGAKNVVLVSSNMEVLVGKSWKIPKWLLAGSIVNLSILNPKSFGSSGLSGRGRQA